MSNCIIPPEITALRAVLNAWRNELAINFTQGKFIALQYLEAEFLKLMTKLRIDIDAQTDELVRDFTMEKYLAVEELEIEFSRLMGKD